MKLALRIDDIGASSKKFEVYSKKRWANIGFLKSVKILGNWAPYPELSVEQWKQIFELLGQFNAKLTVGITACWVGKNGDMTPFPKKFPSQAAVLKQVFDEGLIEIANHGLTHCVVGRHVPNFFGSNRMYHREFWNWLDDSVHFEHIEESQNILQDYFETEITTLIPPGNVFAQATTKAAKKYGINLINCHIEKEIPSEIKIVDNENVLAFHDRELILYGINWLKNKLQQHSDVEYCFVRDL